MTVLTRLLIVFVLIWGMAGCISPQAMKSNSANACLLTEPLWIKPPEDSAVLSPPVYSQYFVNEDRSIWASALWATEEEYGLNVSGKWIKVAWFRPTGTELMITGRRLDVQAPPLESEVNCCYPTRFQVSGLYFPTEGCWKVTARAAENELSFIVRIEP